MAFTKRGLRLIEAFSKFSKEKPIYFDSASIFSKIKFTAANEEHLKAVIPVDSSMSNAYDIMHGGYISAIIDVTCLYAHVVKSNGRLAFTTNMTINFIGSARKGEKIIAEATTVKGGSSPIMESVLYKENGDLIAKGTACFKNGKEDFQRQSFALIGFDVLKIDE